MSAVSRRQLAKGAAWTLPIITTAAAAPHAAASVVCSSTCPTPPSYGGQAGGANGWVKSGAATLAYAATNTPATGANANCTVLNSSSPYTQTVLPGTGGGTLNNVVGAFADPDAAGSTATLSVPVCLSVGKAYTFAFDWNTYAANARGSTLVATVTSSAGTVLATATVKAASQTSNAKGTTTLPAFTVPSSDNYTFSYTWSFDTAPSSYAGTCYHSANDIAVTTYRLTCA